MKKGFTVLELLIFISIFTLVMVAFITILVVVTRLQTRQTSQAEVDQQSQFLLQQLQYNIELSSLVELQQDTPTSTLKLRMASSTLDPTYITLSSGTVYIQQGSGSQIPLTSSKVTVPSLTFVNRSNGSGSHNSVNISFTVAYNTSNITQAFSQLFQTSIARVSAATFDSSVIPSSTTGAYSLGNSGNYWSSINSTMYFVGSNVGIGQSNPRTTLQVDGGNLELGTASMGIILRDSSNVCWKITVSTAGTLQTASSTCP